MHEEQVVEGHDLLPVRRLGGRRVGVDRGDGGLDLERARPVATEAGPHERVSFVDRGPVPEGAVLIREANERTVDRRAGRSAGVGRAA